MASSPRAVSFGPTTVVSIPPHAHTDPHYQSGQHIGRFIEEGGIRPDVSLLSTSWDWVARHPTTFDGMRVTLLMRMEQLPEELTAQMTGQRITWGHLIALLGITHMPEGLEITLRIPDDAGNLRDVDYVVERVFHLVPKWWDLTANAFGLVPVSDRDAPPLVIFAGTENLMQAMGDATPGMSVGQSFFRMGGQEIIDWIGSRKVGAFGISLGGTLTYLLGLALPTQVEVHAFVPAGLLPWSAGGRVNGIAVMDPDDIVSQIGVHPAGLQVAYVPRNIPGCCTILQHHLTLFTPPQDEVVPTINSEEIPCSAWRIFATLVYQLATLVIFPLFLTIYLLYLLCRCVYLLVDLLLR